MIRPSSTVHSISHLHATSTISYLSSPISLSSITVHSKSSLYIPLPLKYYFSYLFIIYYHFYIFSQLKNIVVRVYRDKSVVCGTSGSDIWVVS
jgi:hypothetical protein